MRYSKILVHRDFKTALKKKAAEEDISMLKFTEKIGKEMKHEPLKKKPKFNFKF